MTVLVLLTFLVGVLAGRQWRILCERWRAEAFARRVMEELAEQLAKEQALIAQANADAQRHGRRYEMPLFDRIKIRLCDDQVRGLLVPQEKEASDE